ncbi:MAG: hypothetical protein ABI877_10510 [Gemmatimonadaceae bacterium]
MRQSRLLLLVTSLALVQGCSTWKQRPLPAGAAPALTAERTVRVTRIDGGVLVLEHPRIAGDSLLRDVGNPPQRAVLSLRDVQRIEERRVSLLRTGGLALGTGALLFVIFVAVAISTW